MLKNATQATRHIAAKTPLGDDFFLLKSVSGRSALSQLFEYELELLCSDAHVDPAEIIGKPISFQINHIVDDPLEFHGIVSRFVYKGQTDREVVYSATMVPWLWLLTQTTDCRIFQKKSTPEIIETIFSELGLQDYEIGGLHDEYATRNYCVQYRETDFDFISRLLEEEGIFYFFRQEERKHILVFADSLTAYQMLDNPEIGYPIEDRLQHPVERITSWQRRFQYLSGRVAYSDFNFKSPQHDLVAEESTIVNLEQNLNYELFDFPGKYRKGKLGRKRARVKVEEIESSFEQVSGTSTYHEFSPGGKFKIAEHRNPEEVGREYVLTEVEISADVGSTYNTGDERAVEPYQNRFKCVPSATLFRPPEVTRKAVVEGPQTAVVVGPKGEEIHTDKHGRVKVQFHWDREGKLDEHSSCWIRVSQAHAGGKWGRIDLPRIGEEVIVDFLEGDPDAPIITGRVYNGDNPPPYALPGEKTRSGMKSNTHKGVGYNELTMDDTAGNEQLRMNAQYNMDTAVGNNQTLMVGVDRSEQVGSNDTLKVGVNSQEDVGTDKDVTVGSNLSFNVGNKTVVNAGSSITLKCGASRIHMNSGGVITISGTIITVAAAANAAVAAPLTQVIGGAMLTTMGGINMMSGGVCHVGAAGLASVAGGKVDVAASGKTAIKGGEITLN